MKRILFPDNVLLLTAATTLFVMADDIYADGDPQQVRDCVVVRLLSRGDHIPQERRAVFERIRTLIEEARARGEVSNIEKRILGLEGEIEIRARMTGDRIAVKLMRGMQEITDSLDQKEKVMVDSFLEKCT